jgi:hypothetical protein
MSERAWWIREDEIAHPSHPMGGPKLLLQKGSYHFTGGRPPEEGFRFVWRLANGKLQARGPARIDDLSDVNLLVGLARGKGW